MADPTYFSTGMEENPRRAEWEARKRVASELLQVVSDRRINIKDLAVQIGTTNAALIRLMVDRESQVTMEQVLEIGKALELLPVSKPHKNGWGLVCLDDLERLTTIPLADGATLGSGPGANIRLERPGIEPAHVRFSVRHDGVRATSLAKDGTTKVEGMGASSTMLGHETLLRLGMSLFLFVEAHLQSYEGEIKRFDDMVFEPRQLSVVQDALRYAEQRVPFAIQGGPSTGKSTLAHLAIKKAGLDSELTTIDVLEKDASEKLAEAMRSPRGVWLIKHMDRLERKVQQAVAQFLQQHPETTLIATAAPLFPQPRLLREILKDERRISLRELWLRREVMPALVRILNGGTQLPVDILEKVMNGAMERKDMAEVARMVREGPSRYYFTHGPSRLFTTQCDRDLGRRRLVYALRAAAGNLTKAMKLTGMQKTEFMQQLLQVRDDL